MAHNNTSVAGASGGGEVAGAAGGGDMSSIASLLAEISKSIQALQQALAGSGALAGAAGGGGHGDMAGCDMMGGGAGGESGAVNGANDGAETIGDTVQGGGGHDHAPAKSVDQSDVAGDTGAGKDETPAGKDATPSDVAGDTGKGKDTVVAGTTGGGDPTQKSVEQTANEQAQAALVAADKKSADAATAVTAAGDKVTSAKDGVKKAEADVKTAEAAKKTADDALVDAGQALTAARTGFGEQVADGSVTLEQIAKKHNVTLAKLQELNPSITILGSLPAGTKVKLPKGVGVAGKVAEAQTKLDAARTGATAAAKAVTDAIAALNTAREQLRQAEAALAAAKKAAEDAAKAAADAKKAAEAAAAAEKKAAEDAKAAEEKKAADAATATEAGGGVGGETAPAPKTYTVAPGDTLSGIARKQGIANWRDLYELNKDVIGPNPNLIRPGQVLKLPNGAQATTTTTTTQGGNTQQGGNTTQGGTRPRGNGNGNGNGSGSGTSNGGGADGGTTTTTTPTTTTPTGPSGAQQAAEYATQFLSGVTASSNSIDAILRFPSGLTSFSPSKKSSHTYLTAPRTFGDKSVQSRITGTSRLEGGSYKVAWKVEVLVDGVAVQTKNLTSTVAATSGSSSTSTQPSAVVGTSGGITYNGRKYVVGDFIGPITSDTTRLPGLQRGGRIYPAGFVGPIDSKSVRLPG